jgi:hypothetical protein
MQGGSCKGERGGMKTTIEKASVLRFQSSKIQEWQSVFPDKKSFVDFYQATKNKTFPGSYGQSPCDDAFSVAFALIHGISDSSVEFYSKKILEKDWPGWENKMIILESYGLELPEKIKIAMQCIREAE